MQPVPKSGASFLKGVGVDKWIFIGPQEYPREFSMHLLPNSSIAKMGDGWSSFCDVNDICASDLLRFRFTNAVNRIAYIHRV